MIYANLQASFRAVGRKKAEMFWIRAQADEFIHILVLQALHLKQQSRQSETNDMHFELCTKHL